MDDENETLDWGNEEEDNQESHRKHSSGTIEQYGVAVDDVEDTISLGDDDDDQGFYPYRQNVVDSTYRPFTGNDRKGQDSGPTASNEDTRRRHSNSEREKERECSPLDDSSIKSVSPRKRRSMSKSSPPGSHTRITHALPPKPAILNVPVLPPSHSSIIAATSMTSPLSASRDSKKVNGKATAADLPQDWETRLSRKNEVYYYNRVTHECTWSFPVAKVSVSTPTATHDDSRSHWQQRSVSPTVSRQITSKESNTNISQKSQSNRDSSRNGQSDPGNEDVRRPRTPDLNLTYEDRHYRPGGDSFATSNTVRAVERLEISPKTGRYARSPSPRRRRARTISPDSRGTELRARAKDPSRDQRSGREKSAYTNPTPKLDSYRPEYERRRSPSPRPPSPTEYAMRLDREPRERASRRLPDQDSMSVDLPDYKSGRPPGRKEESNREQRGRSRDRNPPIRDLDPGQSAKQSNYVSAQRSRSPLQQLQPRERDRGAQERERDQQTRGREAERNYDDPPRYRHSPPHLPAGVSDSKERDFDREIERDRPRRSDRSDSRWANGPSTATKTQDVASHLRSRESDKPVDTVTDRRDGVFDRERDKERERGRGLERDSDRGRPEPLPEGTSHSRQRLPDRHPPGSSRSNADDTQRRSGEDNNSASGEVSSNRPKRAPLPPQQASFRSARLREPTLHATLNPAVRADVTLAPNSNVPRQPRSQIHAGAPDVRHPRNEPRQNTDSVLSRTRSSSDMKMDVDQEVPKSGRRLSPLGVRNPESTERNRPEFDSQHPSRTSSASERRPDLPLGTPSGPAALSRDSVKYVQNDNSRPDDKFGKEGGDRVVRPAEPERSSSRRTRDPPSQPAARLTGTNNIPIKSRRSAAPASRPSDLVIPKQPSSASISRLPASDSVPGNLSNPTPINPPRDLPPGKECYERPLDLVLSDPPRRSGRSGEKTRPRESRFSKKPDDRSQLQAPQSATGQDRIRNNSVKHSRDLSDSTPTAPKASVTRSTDGWPDGRPNGGETAVASSDRLPSKPRESNFKPPGTARDTQSNILHSSSSLTTEHPARTSVDDLDNTLSQRLRANEEHLPPRLKSAPQTIRDDDWPNDSTANDVSKVEGRSPFISRVEPPRPGSLLDRLSIDDNRHRSSASDRLAPSPSLRDRLLPSKRDRDEMLKGEGPSSRPELNDRFYEPDEGSETKRARKRGGKGRRSGGGGGGNGRKF